MNLHLDTEYQSGPCAKGAGIGAAMTTYRAVLHQIQTYTDRRFLGVAVPSTVVMTGV